MRQCMDTLGATKRYDDLFRFIERSFSSDGQMHYDTPIQKDRKNLFNYRSTKEEVSLVSIMDSPFIMYNHHLMGIDTIRNTP